jgi:signal transduction histidine kinase
VAPLVWLVPAFSTDVSDGTVVSSPTAVLGDARWGSSVTVLDTYGDTPLRPGDELLSIEQTPMADWAGGETRPVEPGEVLDYEVRRGAGGIDLIQDIEVPVTAYPVGPAVVANLHRVVLALGLLVAGSFLVWRGARRPLALVTLGAGSAAGVGLTAAPFGPQAVDLLQPGGLTQHAVGEAALAVTLGALLLLVTVFPDPPSLGGARRRALWALAPLLAPAAGYAVWLLTYAAALAEPARTQAALDVTLPAAATAALLAVPAIAVNYRAAEPQQRVAVRLLVVATLAGALLVAILHVAPVIFRGAPLVPWDVLAVLLIPLVLACWVAAVLDYRLLEVDALLRRSLVQLVLVTLLGALFLVAVGAVNVTSGGSLRSMVTGGVVVMILLPVAFVLRRTLRRLVYGERADPAGVVTRLRRLDSGTGPEEALRETLVLLSRSLQLSYAAIEGTGDDEAEPFHISLGELRGQPTSVELEVAGQPLGRLDMEVSLMRDPFGPRDRRLLEDVGTQVGSLLQALLANRRLREARERLVAAREEERRRLRRDLHDGLGPTLASTLIRLEAAQELIDTDPRSAAELVGRLVQQTEASIAEIRRLVEGLRPPILDQLGLAAALRSHAAEHNQAAAVARGATPTWSVDAEDLGVLPAAVEVAAYRIAVEAVNNAVRHSHGSHCEVVVRRREDAVDLEIRDDGSGPDGAPGRGVGMGSMRERAEELGGTWTVRSRPGGGTSVTASIPLIGGTDEEGTG